MPQYQGCTWGGGVQTPRNFFVSLHYPYYIIIKFEQDKYLS